MIGAGYRLPAG